LQRLTYNQCYIYYLETCTASLVHCTNINLNPDKLDHLLNSNTGL
jgi:hypothetical protein